MNGSAYVANFLIKKGVKKVFGYQGTKIATVIDAIASSKDLEYIQNYHEQASAFCAEMYSKLNQNEGIGVAIATSGPGATNLITGIANCHSDSIPCLFIVGEDYKKRLRKSERERVSAFQEADIVNMVKPITKYAVSIDKPEMIKYELEKAFYMAKEGRPGASLVQILTDIQLAEINEETLITFEPPEQSFSDNKIKEILSEIKKSKRPILLLGGGAVRANIKNEILKFKHKTNMPVVTTLMGKEFDFESIGMSGVYGNPEANLAIYNSDLLIALGVYFSANQVGISKEEYAPYAKIIQIDIDKEENNRNIATDIFVNANLKDFIHEINKVIKDESFDIHKKWFEEIEKWTQKYKHIIENKTSFLSPTKFIKDISNYFANDAIITCDIGQNQMWAAQAFKTKQEQRFINSGSFGPMGYSLPAAICAKIMRPENQVIALMGDGGLQMNLQELQLIRNKHLNIKCFIFNNNTLGMMKELQDKYMGGRHHGADERHFSCVDIKLLAKTYDFDYLKITKNSNLKNIENCLKSSNQCLIDVRIDSEEKLFNKYHKLEIFEREKIND